MKDSKLKRIEKEIEKTKKDISNSLDRLYNLGLVPYYGFYENLLDLSKEVIES